MPLTLPCIIEKLEICRVTLKIPVFTLQNRKLEKRRASMSIQPFSSEQARVIVNLEQAYQVSDTYFDEQSIIFAELY
jgi:hypothetical protein